MRNVRYWNLRTKTGSHFLEKLQWVQLLNMLLWRNNALPSLVKRKLESISVAGQSGSGYSSPHISVIDLEPKRNRKDSVRLSRLRSVSRKSLASHLRGSTNEMQNIRRLDSQAQPRPKRKQQIKKNKNESKTRPKKKAYVKIVSSLPKKSHVNFSEIF